MTAPRPTALLFTLGDRAPTGLGEAPCYLYRRKHAKKCRFIEAIPEAPCDEESTSTMFEALDRALEDWALVPELYTDAERADRDGTDSEPIVFHPGLDLDRARAALEKGGFRVVVFRPQKGRRDELRGNPVFASAEEALTALAHHLEHASLDLARKVTPKTFSHHHLERARHALRSGASAKFSTPFLEGLATLPKSLSKSGAAVFELLVAHERKTDGVTVASPSKVKVTVKSKKR